MSCKLQQSQRCDNIMLHFQIAVERGCSRVDWHSQQWNKVAADFYHKQGAVCLDEWQVYHLTGEHLLEFAGKNNYNIIRAC